MPDGFADFMKKKYGKSAPQPKPASDFASFMASKQQPEQPPERSALDAFIGGGAESIGSIASSVSSLAGAVGSAATGDFRPLGEMAEAAGRGALKFAAGFDPANSQQTYAAVSAEQDPRLAELARRVAERDAKTTPGRFIQSRNRELAAESAKDTSTTNKIAGGAGRFAVAALPTVATGIASGGSVPLMAATGALQSAGQPESIVPSAIIGTAPLPVGQAVKAGVNAIRRRFGSGAAQIIEAEALPAAKAQVQQAIGEAAPAPTRPTLAEAAGEVQGPARPTQPLPRTIVENQPTAPLPPANPTVQRATQAISREASSAPAPLPGESMVQSRFPRDRQAPLMEMPGTPNAIQQPGVLPRTVGRTELPPTAREIAPNSEGLARAIGASGDDISNVTARELGLESKMPPPRPPNAKAAQRNIPIEDITLGRDSLNRGRMFQVQEALRGGVKAEKKGVPLREQIEPIEVVPDPQNPGKWIVENDGNHRIALMKLQGKTGDVPVKAWEAPTQAKQPFPDAELEAVQPQFGVRQARELPYTETVGPSVDDAMSMSVSAPAQAPPLNAAVSSAVQAIPRPIAERVKNELLGGLGALKSLKSAFDISAPFRQGALLMLRPLQWRQAGKAWAQMFKAFKSKDFEAIKQAIDSHPDAQLMDDAGLYLANRTNQALNQGEEAFLRRSGSKISEAVSKTPGIKQSDQMYSTFLDTQRVERFAQFKQAIDKAGLSPEDAMKGYKAAAEWVNIATGRGSLGQRFDKAFDALSFFLFSPRYVASRLNVFNPAMYARNLATPGGRVVLKQQMADLAQFAGTVATVMYMAKSAGADVGLNPNSSDFLKIKLGNWRYDTLAGLQQVMRLFYRVGADIGRAGRGEKPKFGKTAIDIGETFLSYKLSPPAAVFRDFINQRTVDRKPFSYGGAAADLVAPIQWADFVEAYQKEGWGGVGAALPGMVGIGANLQDPSPVDAAIEKHRPLFSELERLNKRVSDLRKRDGEADEAFNRRVQQFSQNYTQYGQRLLDNPRFKAAPDNIKSLALDSLNNRAKFITGRDLAFPELELDANTIMDAAEASKKNPARK